LNSVQPDPWPEQLHGSNCTLSLQRVWASVIGRDSRGES
jgi:hypothetical protein